jgi:hypothetical protein
MPYPSMTFTTIAQWENYLNTNIVTNGAEEITGLIGNNAYNGAVTFIKQSPLNWSKADIYSLGGDIDLQNIFLGVAVFITTTPDSLSFGDNFYNQYVFINMTAASIPLGTPSGYVTASGTTINVIPANSVVILMKAENDIWIQINSSSGGGGSVQKEPKTYIVGTDTGAPTALSSIWALPAFVNSYVVLFVNGGKANQKDGGQGNPYITKASLASDTITIGNYTGGWQNGDVLDYILITP